MSDNDTIYALSSGGLPSGIAVVRLSGSGVREILQTMCGSVPAPRYASLMSIRNQNNFLIDRGLTLFFPSPASFTGEDCAEFHLHGGRAVVDACLNMLTTFANCRLAEAGEFSKRAFDNGKIDLTAAEGLADLIAAETQAQLSLALEQSSGRLANVYNGWADRILKNRAMIEAELDFSDEEDVPGSVSEQVWSNIMLLIEEIEQHISGASIGEVARSGYSIVLAGAPNAGKSTLLNRLAGRDVAIVSSEAGTTRDILEVRLDLDGYLVLVKDTAGVREGKNAVEREGITRAQAEFKKADLILHLIEVNSAIGKAVDFGNIPDEKILNVRTKCDLLRHQDRKDGELLISAEANVGIDRLISVISQRVCAAVCLDDKIIPTRRRYVEALEKSCLELRLACQSVDIEIELRAEHLRRAQLAIGRITGQADVEDLLGVIFSEFCIGK